MEIIKISKYSKWQKRYYVSVLNKGDIYVVVFDSKGKVSWDNNTKPIDDVWEGEILKTLEKELFWALYSVIYEMAESWALMGKNIMMNSLKNITMVRVSKLMKIAMPSIYIKDGDWYFLGEPVTMIRTFERR